MSRTIILTKNALAPAKSNRHALLSIYIDPPKVLSEDGVQVAAREVRNSNQINAVTRILQAILVDERGKNEDVSFGPNEFQRGRVTAVRDILQLFSLQS